jgi:hypothetical protein
MLKNSAVECAALSLYHKRWGASSIATIAGSSNLDVHRPPLSGSLRLCCRYFAGGRSGRYG